MKHEYDEGPAAREKFDKEMAKLFQVKKDAAKEKPKPKPKRKKPSKD